MSNKREYRIFKLELRAAEGTQPQIEGYAAVFNTETDLGYLREKIAPGAFTRAITEKQDVRALFNHDSNHVLGRTVSGTLTLEQDDKGLKFRCDMPDTQVGRDVHTLIKRGDISQCSFGFIVRDEEMNYSSDIVTRTIKDVDLFDVSPVTYPAYPTTSVEARSNEVTLKKYRDDDGDEMPHGDDVGKCMDDCEACKSGDCSMCSNENCDDENCRCNMRSLRKAKAKTRLAEISLTL